jgi:hypothetical protein
MGTERLYRSLEQSFVATFMKELIPGILHNFANPLGGIMGRNKLLRKRLAAAIEKVRTRRPELFAELEGDFRRALADVDAIDSESDKLYGMFRDLADKFYTLPGRETGQIDVSSLVEREMRFADFYLDFKHDLQKRTVLDTDVPQIAGRPADWSLCIWSLLRHAFQGAPDGPATELAVFTGHDEECVFLTLQSSGRGGGRQAAVPSGGEGPGAAASFADARALLESYGATVELTQDGGTRMVSVKIPRRAVPAP